MEQKRKITFYDTTLRDGSQTVGITFSLQDKIRIARELDRFKIDYIEGGWPGANPKDTQFFEEIRNAGLTYSKVAAFCSTKRHDVSCKDDPLIQAMVNSHADILTIFTKSWDFHVTKALGISLKDNLTLLKETVMYMKDKGFTVFVDGEHFYDGYNANSDYALEIVNTAKNAGADMFILCDTNGGMIPSSIYNITKKVCDQVSIPLGVHCHNDTDCAVANSLAAIEAGAQNVQGTINGIGERCGNANLCSIIANTVLKMNCAASCETELMRLTSLSKFVSETANITHALSFSYVGDSAFAHKGGIHVSAINKDARTYEHISPERVGNIRHVTISEQSGKSNVSFKAQELGIEVDDKNVPKILAKVKELEKLGFQFEGAEASLELIIQEIQKKYKPYFILKGFRILSEKKEDSNITTCEASIKVEVDGKLSHTAANGTGPVGALDSALRKALYKFYPEIKEIQLEDYKVRVLDSKRGANSAVRVLMNLHQKNNYWTTLGVSDNIIEASWQAMVDGIEFMLYKKVDKDKEKN